MYPVVGFAVLVMLSLGRENSPRLNKFGAVVRAGYYMLNRASVDGVSQEESVSALHGARAKPGGVQTS